MLDTRALLLMFLCGKCSCLDICYLPLSMLLVDKETVLFENHALVQSCTLHTNDNGIKSNSPCVTIQSDTSYDEDVTEEEQEMTEDDDKLGGDSPNGFSVLKCTILMLSKIFVDNHDSLF